MVLASTNVAPWPTTGYREVGSDGTVYASGTALSLGSTAPYHPAAPIVAMAATSDRKGYWLVAADGGVFCFGDAPFAGSLASWSDFGEVSISPAGEGDGYLIALSDGMVVPFGSAVFEGDAAQLPLAGPIVGIAP